MAMMYDVTILPGAKQNLLDVTEYLSQFYPSTAEKFLKNLHKKLSLLQEQPHIGAKYIPNPKYRKLVVGDYLAFYIVDEEHKKVEIYRVLRSSWDIERHLTDD